MTPIPTDADFERLALDMGAVLRHRGLLLVTAESCTGGWIAQVVTSVEGSSNWFERGFVTYSNTAKAELLGVPTATLTQHGAVSEQAARAMAEGALKHSRADVALAVTGIAGPGGGSPDKPVGTVWFAWARKGGETLVSRQHYSGNREAVRRQAVATAVSGLIELVRSR